MSTLKPLPKAILIGIVVAAVGYGITKVLPEPKTQPAPSISVVDVPATPTQPAEEPPVQATVETEAPTAPLATVSNGGAGLDAVLKAGQK